MRKTIHILLLLLITSCTDFLALDLPKDQISPESVFADDVGVRSAVAGVLVQMMSANSFAGGGSSSLSLLAGLSADEYINYSISVDQSGISSNGIQPANSTITGLWSNFYLIIYETNTLLEGLERPSIVSEKVRVQTRGEALFVRSLCYFYLVNLFGDVPLILTTNYEENKSAFRTPVDQVYARIEEDLLNARELLPTDFSISNNERIEPNRGAVTALLARMYLYQERWAEAEAMSSELISNPTYSLVTNLNSVFLKNSPEAIWQLMPVLTGLNTNESPMFIITTNPSNVSLSGQTLNAFEPGDKRRTSWVGSVTITGRTYQYPYKYKVNTSNAPVTEYLAVFRLAEQYLIRAEARAKQGKIAEATADINVVRQRAGVTLLNSNSQTQQSLTAAIEKERFTEFFSEWGHRWFDLKRTGRANAVLGPIKTDWQPTDQLYPIPQTEINSNVNLTQNPGV